MLEKKPEELLHFQGKEMTRVTKKLNAFTEKVREDIEKKMISEEDGQELIVKATIVVSMMTTT